MKVLSELVLVCALFYLDANGMCSNVFETLDAYKNDICSLSENELQRSYQEAVLEIQQLILDAEKALNGADGVGLCAEIEEGAIDEESIRSRILLCKERLYDLSSDGELGKKILSVFQEKTIDVESYEQMIKEVAKRK